MYNVFEGKISSVICLSERRYLNPADCGSQSAAAAG